MSGPQDHSDNVVAEIAAKAAAVAALAERIGRDGEEILPHERRAQLRAIRDALIDAGRIVEAAAQEAESARAVRMAAPQHAAGTAWVARYVPTSDDLRRVNAVFQQQANPALLAEMVRQFEERRTLAAEVARTLLAEQPQLRKLATAGNSEAATHDSSRPMVTIE